MATRAKDANVKKDKKPIASSQAQRQGNPRPVASQLGSNDKVTNPGRKPAPNYLRPTLSSKPETPTRTTRKSNTAGSANNEDKARLLRRRSLDRPPSLSRQDSAGTNKEAAASRLRTSSSVKSTGNSSNRAASSGHKPGGSRSVNPALKSQLPLRRSSSSSSYKNGISSAPVSSTTSPIKADEDQNAKQVHPDELETSDKEHLDQNLPQEVLVEESEGELLDGAEEGELENLNRDEKSQGGKEEEEEERSNIQAEDSSPDEVRVSDQDKGEEEDVVEGQEHAACEQPAEEEAEREEEEGARDEATGEEVVNQVAKEAEAQQEEDAPAGSVRKRVVVQGKKESPSAYNDVIEETKNKLLEARKNKVKALVGAFETVIDYESGSK